MCSTTEVVLERDAFTFRPVAPDDGPALCNVHRTSIFTLARHAYSSVEIESWVHGITPDSDLAAMAAENHVAEVALNDQGRIVVFCSVRDDEVMALYVHPDAAGKGLGRQLMQRAEEQIAASGHRMVRVEASASGLAFYERLGYMIMESGDFPSRGGLLMRAHKLTKSLLPRAPSGA